MGALRDQNHLVEVDIQLARINDLRDIRSLLRSIRARLGRQASDRARLWNHTLGCVSERSDLCHLALDLSLFLEGLHDFTAAEIAFLLKPLNDTEHLSLSIEPFDNGLVLVDNDSDGFEQADQSVSVECRRFR